MANRPMLKQKERTDYMADYDSLRSRIEIDRGQLDKVAADQAQVYLECCERHVSVQSLRDRAKDDLAKEDARLGRTERVQLAKDGEKATEKMIADAVLLHPDRVALKSEYDALAEATDRWGRLVAAYEQRMRMVRECVALYTSNYFTNMTIKGDAGQIRDQLASVARDRLDTDRKQRRER